MNLAIGSTYALQNSTRGSTYGYNSTTLGAALIYLTGNLVSDMEVFTMHKVFLDFVHLYRTEGTKANVKCNLTIANPLSLDALKELVGEMKTCSRSGSRALLFSIDGLVVALVFKLLGDVWRERHIAYRVKHLVYRLVFVGIVIESHNTIAAINNISNSSLKDAAKVKG